MEIERARIYHPGDFSYDWLKDYPEALPIEEEALIYWTKEDLDNLRCEFSKNKVYLIKWKNLSYTEATWEHYSYIQEWPEKL